MPRIIRAEPYLAVADDMGKRMMALRVVPNDSRSQTPQEVITAIFGKPSAQVTGTLSG